MAETKITATNQLVCRSCGNECNDECRGPRGHQGERGKRGKTGPTGSTGPTGPSGLVSFVEDQSLSNVLLPQNSTTEVLACDPITPPVGSLVEISALINYQATNNTTGQTRVLMELLEDGAPLTNSIVTPGAILVGMGIYEMDAPIPILWHLTGDGLPHVYSVNVTTLPTTDGVQTASRRSLLVEVFTAED